MESRMEMRYVYTERRESQIVIGAVSLHALYVTIM